MMQRAIKDTGATALKDIISDLERSGDLRRAIASVNARIVDHQSEGQEVPAGLLRLSKALARECAAQSQGR